MFIGYLAWSYTNSISGEQKLKFSFKLLLLDSWGWELLLLLFRLRLFKRELGADELDWLRNGFSLWFYSLGLYLLKWLMLDISWIELRSSICWLLAMISSIRKGLYGLITPLCCWMGFSTTPFYYINGWVLAMGSIIISLLYLLGWCWKRWFYLVDLCWGLIFAVLKGWLWCIGC